MDSQSRETVHRRPRAAGMHATADLREDALRQGDKRWIGIREGGPAADN